jgi:pimeloyl-ACP methyl ester carboxylesterase
MIVYRSTAIFFALALVSTTGAHAAPATPDGHWQGVMKRDGAAMTVRFDFQTEAGTVTGRFTSEIQRALEYPLDDVSYLEPKLHWKLGDSLIFDGVVSPESISGTFEDGQARGTFSLKPVKLDAPPYSREDITFRNGGVILSGTLLRPKSAGLHPGIVFLHGSGPESRWGTSFFLADRFARQGVAALVFDKRGVGQSTGDWKTISYQVLADDYMAGIHFLAGQPGVNPRQVGIYGHSQGATMSPIIASKLDAVAFVIAAAAIGTGPLYTQDLYRTRNELLDSGLSGPALSRAMDLYSQWLTVARTGEGWDELDRAVAKSKSEPWFDRLELPLQKNDWLYQWYPPVGNFNPLPLWERVRVPVLLIYGERDRNTPVAPSLAGIGEALKKAGNSDFTPLIIPGAAHNLTIQWQSGEPFFWWYAAPRYSDLLTAWVRMRFSGK